MCRVYRTLARATTPLPADCKRTFDPIKRRHPDTVHDPSGGARSSCCLVPTAALAVNCGGSRGDPRGAPLIPRTVGSSSGNPRRTAGPPRLRLSSDSRSATSPSGHRRTSRPPHTSGRVCYWQPSGSDGGRPPTCRDCRRDDCYTPFSARPAGGYGEGGRSAALVNIPSPGRTLVMLTPGAAGQSQSSWSLFGGKPLLWEKPG